MTGPPPAVWCRLQSSASTRSSRCVAKATCQTQWGAQPSWMSAEIKICDPATPKMPYRSLGRYMGLFVTSKLSPFLFGGLKRSCPPQSDEVIKRKEFAVPSGFCCQCFTMMAESATHAPVHLQLGLSFSCTHWHESCFHKTVQLLVITNHITSLMCPAPHENCLFS